VCIRSPALSTGCSGGRMGASFTRLGGGHMGVEFGIMVSRKGSRVRVLADRYLIEEVRVAPSKAVLSCKS
jgi:hypothetical protein